MIVFEPSFHNSEQWVVLDQHVVLNNVLCKSHLARWMKDYPEHERKRRKSFSGEPRIVDLLGTQNLQGWYKLWEDKKKWKSKSEDSSLFLGTNFHRRLWFSDKFINNIVNRINVLDISKTWKKFKIFLRKDFSRKEFFPFSYPRKFTFKKSQLKTKTVFLTSINLICGETATTLGTVNCNPLRHVSLRLSKKWFNIRRSCSTRSSRRDSVNQASFTTR